MRSPSTKNSSRSGDQSMRTVWNWLKSSASEHPPASAVPVPQECLAEWATELMPAPAEHFCSVPAEPDVAGGGRRKFSMISISPLVRGRVRGRLRLRRRGRVRGLGLGWVRS